MKQYIGIIRDHSGSMAHLREKAREDYNRQIESIKQASHKEGIDTIVSVVECGAGRTGTKEFRRDVVNSSVESLKPIPFGGYNASGGSTPLNDSIVDLIHILKSVPDKNEKDVAFLLLIITDGEENASYTPNYQLAEEIKKLQATDKWTFTFRVPLGALTSIVRNLSVHRGNVVEWEQTEQGFERVTKQTINSTQAYYGARTMGMTASQGFYADIADVPLKQVKRDLEEITKEVKVLKVVKGGQEIRPFIENQMGSYRPGAAFYQLTKKEKAVQAYKQVIIRDKINERLYGGEEARNILGLPKFGTMAVNPGDHGRYDIFLQSTSTNRKLVAGTEVVYWPGVRL